MCRLVFVAVTLISIHTLCRDLATAGVSTHVKASPVPGRSLAISRAPEPASTLLRVQTCTSGISSYDQTFVTVLGGSDCITGTGRDHDIFNPRY
jgi:hypothetical protein